MAWIKRNLYFVIIVVVGLGLTGYCGYLLYSALDQNKADSDKYFSDKSSLDSLQKKNPFPDEKNIQAAMADADRVRTFLEDFHKPFAVYPPPPQMDDQHFHEYLQISVMQFSKEATNAGVGLPAGYAFTFSQQLNVLNYPSGCIQPWIQQLAEIKTILNILYRSKINYLQEIKRPTVSGEDMVGNDYLQVPTVTNSIGVVTPYMISFRAFSAEIANVLEGFAASSNCLIVKTIHVEPSREPLPQLADLVATPAPPPRMQFRPPPETYNPYGQPPGNPFGRGRGERRGPPPMQQPQYAPAEPNPTAATGPAGPVTILTETPLFVTIYVDVVKLKALEKPAPPAAAAAKPARRGR